jgi:hypothetical protein
MPSQSTRPNSLAHEVGEGGARCLGNGRVRVFDLPHHDAGSCGLQVKFFLDELGAFQGAGDTCVDFEIVVYALVHAIELPSR